MLIFFIVTLVFIAGTLLAWALGGLLGAERETVALRLEAIARPVDPPSPLPSLAEAELERGWRERLWQPALRRLARLGSRVAGAGTSDRLRSALARAGHPAGIGMGEFHGLRVLSVLLCLGVALPICAFFALLGARLILLCLLVLSVVIGLALPDALLEQKVRERQGQIRRALPDAIDLLVVSVEAGLGLDGALAKVTEKMRGPLSEELARAMDEMRLGKTRGQALRDMAGRLEIGEVKTFVAAVTQADQLGTSIAGVLRAQSGMARQGGMQRVREQAARLPVTLLFPLVVFIFPAVFVVLLGPSLLRLYEALARMN